MPFWTIAVVPPLPGRIVEGNLSLSASLSGVNKVDSAKICWGSESTIQAEQLL